MEFRGDSAKSKSEQIWARSSGIVACSGRSMTEDYARAGQRGLPKSSENDSAKIIEFGIHQGIQLASRKLASLADGHKSPNAGSQNNACHQSSSVRQTLCFWQTLHTVVLQKHTVVRTCAAVRRDRHISAGGSRAICISVDAAAESCWKFSLKLTTHDLHGGTSERLSLVR